MITICHYAPLTPLQSVGPTGLDPNKGIVVIAFLSVFTSRWISRDPIAEKGGLNLYAYCANDPINEFDPLGSSFWKALFAGIGVVGAVAAISVGLGLASPILGIITVVGGAAAFGLNLLAFDNATADEPNYYPSNIFGLAGRGIDCMLGEESGPNYPLGPFQTALDPVGGGFFFVPKAYTIENTLQGMISTSTSPLSPIVPQPPGPWSKP